MQFDMKIINFITIFLALFISNPTSAKDTDWFAVGNCVGSVIAMTQQFNIRPQDVKPAYIAVITKYNYKIQLVLPKIVVCNNSSKTTSERMACINNIQPKSDSSFAIGYLTAGGFAEAKGLEQTNINAALICSLDSVK